MCLDMQEQGRHTWTNMLTGILLPSMVQLSPHFLLHQSELVEEPINCNKPLLLLAFSS